MHFSRGVLMLEWPARRHCVPPLEPYVSWPESKEWASSEEEYWSTMAGFLPADKLYTLLQDLRGDRMLPQLDKATFEKELATQNENLPEFLKREGALSFISDKFLPGKPPVSVRSELLGDDDGIGFAFPGVGDWADPLSPKGDPEKIAAAVRLLHSARRFPGLPPKVVRRGSPRYPSVGWTVPFLIGERRLWFACAYLNIDSYGPCQFQMIIMGGCGEFVAHSQGMGTSFSKSFIEDITRAYALEPLSHQDISGVLYCAIMHMSLSDPCNKVPRWFFNLQDWQPVILQSWLMMTRGGLLSTEASPQSRVWVKEECNRDWDRLCWCTFGPLFFTKGEMQTVLRGKLGNGTDSVGIGVLENWDGSDEYDDDEHDEDDDHDESWETVESWEDDNLVFLDENGHVVGA